MSSCVLDLVHRIWSQTIRTKPIFFPAGSRNLETPSESVFVLLRDENVAWLPDYHGLLAVWTFAANRSVCNHSRLQNASCKITRTIAVTLRSYFFWQILLGTEQLPAWTCPRKPIVAMLKSAKHSANADQRSTGSMCFRVFATFCDHEAVNVAYMCLLYMQDLIIWYIQTFRMVLCIAFVLVGQAVWLWQWTYHIWAESRIWLLGTRWHAPSGLADSMNSRGKQLPDIQSWRDNHNGLWDKATNTDHVLFQVSDLLHFFVAMLPM